MPKSPRQTLQSPVLDRSSERSEDVPSGGSADGVEGDALISLLYRLPDAVLVLDRDWRITFANEEARRISRLHPHDLNNRTLWELYPETSGTEIERLYHEVMETGVSVYTEHYHAPFDVHLDVHVIPQAGRGGARRDVTAVEPGTRSHQ